ncbi:MAG TPA: Mov34/MPN/PAD-1 family protein, partial [Solirubrobacteraceae bacterium]|nr:Mov34/MPN/PAD-1 family protein [Solirubrobacteraceae bacterium]
MDIASELLDQIVAHARADAPNECCGIVAVIPGSDGQSAQATRVRAARNVHASPKRFEIDGKDVLSAINEFDEAGWDIGAIYHS